jgi:hypothetical protein
MGEASRILPDEEPSARIGLRLASWYAIVFVITSLAIVLLTYRLLEASLAERDRQLVVSTLREYSQRYAAGGLASLADAVEIEQRSGRQERLLVRVVRGRSETLFLSAPYAWSDFDMSRLTGIDGLEQILSMSGTARLEEASGLPTARCSRSARAARAGKHCSLDIVRCWRSSPSSLSPSASPAASS